MPDAPAPRCAVEKLESEELSREEAVAALLRKEEAQLAKHGFYVHYVFGDHDSPTGVNVHTHGLQDGFDHPDFQLILPLTPELANDILCSLADDVKAGKRFAAGDLAGGIIRGYDVGFADATEGGRMVLRVVIPDPEGRTARGEIGEEYARQYEGTR